MRMRRISQVSQDPEDDGWITIQDSVSLSLRSTYENITVMVLNK